MTFGCKSEKKLNQLTVRLNDDEFEVLKTYVSVNGGQPSVVVREKALEKMKSELFAPQPFARNRRATDLCH